MLELGINGYTRQEVIDQLHGKNGSRGLVKIRYDLLNRQDVKLGELAVQSGRVSMNSLAEIKRTALFELTEQEARDVDWLNDRIRPVFCLKMPEIRKTYKAWGKIDASFSRSSIAYLSDGTQVAANAPRFEPGKFGKALMVEEGTVNLENSWDGWTKAPGSTLTQISAYEYQFTGGVTSGAFLYKFFNYSGKTITFQVEIKGEGDAIGKRARWQSARIDYYGESVTLTNEYQKLVGTVQFPSDNVAVGIALIEGISSSDVVYLRFKQLEEKPYPTSFTPGTRSAETLTIPTAGVLNPQEGTISVWVYVNDILKDSIVNSRHIIDARGSGNNALILYHDRVTRNFRFRLRNYSGVEKDLDIPDSVVTNGWHFFSVKWSQTNMTLCIDNNVQFAENPPLPSDLSTCVIGRHPSVPATTINTLIDDLRISSRALTDAEILAAYQSNKPLPIDQWTTKFSFDDKLSGDYFTLVDRDISAQWIEWPLGVFLLSSPTRKDENRQVKRSIEAYDSSLILKEDKFTDRYVIEAGTKYTDAIIDILNAAGIWKVNIIDHPGTLATDREFEIGTEKLYAVNELLAAINYTSLWVDENGYFVAQPYVLPSSRDPEYEYRTDDLSIIHPDSGVEELDLFGVPNKWVRYVSNPDRNIVLRSEYINDLSTSPTSTINRGRTIVDIDSVEDIYDQATLDEYVKRIAYNANQIYGKFEFATALMPHHSYYNCLFVEYGPLGISHKYMESSWSMDLQPGGKMRHSCRRVIQI